MNKAELVAAMSDKAQLSKTDAEAALKAFTDVVAEELKKDYTDGIPYSYADEIISFWKNKENKEKTIINQKKMYCIYY